jgi:hypothetical protein
VQRKINAGTGVRVCAASENSQVGIKRKLIINISFGVDAVVPGRNFGFPQAAPAGSGQPFVVEYYCKAKWGHADEFQQLFKKNHYPLLKKEVEMGRLRKIWMDHPRYHTTEDGHWHYRVAIVFKNAPVANEPYDENALKKQLFPEKETYVRATPRRFEILDAHWDLPVRSVDLEAK